MLRVVSSLPYVADVERTWTTEQPDSRAYQGTTVWLVIIFADRLRDGRVDFVFVARELIIVVSLVGSKLVVLSITILTPSSLSPSQHFRAVWRAVVASLEILVH